MAAHPDVIGAIERAGLTLTKRELFAAFALQGIMANPVRWKQIADDYVSGKKTYEQCSQANAAKAVSLADALIAELAKEQTP